MLSRCGGATLFGGMLGGPETVLTNVLSSLIEQRGLRWMRSSSSRPAEYGFAWLDDLRYHLPGVRRAPELLPTNLFEVYGLCRTNLPQAASAFEVWNEPDFYFVQSSAADMAAVLKAAWWGVKSSRPETPVLMPSLAFRPSRYALELAHNGLASWTDGLNLHFYGWGADFQPFLAHHRAFAKAMGLQKPWWLTEVGFFQLPAAAATEPDFLARQAAFHERMMLESWTAGIACHLAFSLTPAIEAGSDLGLTDAEGRWRPALSSMARLASLLTQTKPRSFLIHEPSDSTVGLILEQPDGKWWSVFWSPGRPGEIPPPQSGRVISPPERLRLRVTWPNRIREIQAGLEGQVTLDSTQISEIDLSPVRNVHLRSVAARYELSDCRWIPVTQVLARQPRVLSQARRELRELPRPGAPSPVVLRLGPGSLRADKPSQTLRLAPAERAKAVLELYNFKDTAARGSWWLDVPRGWVVENLRSNSSPPGIDGSQLQIPPLSRLEVPLHIACDADASPEPARLCARWFGSDGSEDTLSVCLGLDRALPPVWHPFAWQEFVPRPGHASAWQVFETGPGQFSLEMHEPSGEQRDALVFFPVPKGTRSSDVFAAKLWSEPPRGRTFCQAFLVTKHGEVWRHGEWEAIPAAGLPLRATLGDFAPTIWSRHYTLLFPPLRDARWLALRFQGLHSGQIIRIEDLSIRRWRDRE